MNYFRHDRLNSLIKNIISNLLYKLPNDLYQFSHINLTKVILNNKITLAKIFYTDYKKNNFSKLEIQKFQFFIKRQLSKELYIRKIPDIRILKDNFDNNFQKITDILDKNSN